MSLFIPPSYNDQSFRCPHCGVVSQFQDYPVIRAYKGAQQFRRNLFNPDFVEASPRDFFEFFDRDVYLIKTCTNCGRPTVWFKGQMVYPSGTGVTPVDCMPENVKTVFLEAQSIGGISPRASAAMLRVALERLVNDVGGKGSNLAGKIASLHLSPRLQKLCDICRAAGNEAVHHESFDFSASNEEARAMVEALSEFINRLADEFCGLEKAADELQRKINAARTK